MTVEKTKKELTADKHPQYDLLICDVADAAIKDLLPSLEFPFYTLSKKPDTSIREFESKGNWIKIIPSALGAATIYDKDIMIYAVSQIVAKINNKEPVSKRVKLNCYELLQFANRSTSGRDYKSLQNSLDRLEGTRIRTNICRNGEEVWEAFGLLDKAKTVREFGHKGRLLSCEITLSDWIFDAITTEGILQLSRDYFRLGKPIERRMYELARKHCGDKKEFKMGLELLYKKSGAQSDFREFRRWIKNLESSNHLPDYLISYSREKDMVTFQSTKPRKPKKKVAPKKADNFQQVNYSNNTQVTYSSMSYENKAPIKATATSPSNTKQSGKDFNQSKGEKRARITAAIMDIHDTNW